MHATVYTLQNNVCMFSPYFVMSSHHVGSNITLKKYLVVMCSVMTFGAVRV